MRVTLTPAELEVLALVARGWANKEIASARGTSIQVIKNQMTSIMNRLDAKDRTHAVVIAHRRGVLELHGEIPYGVGVSQ